MQLLFFLLVRLCLTYKEMLHAQSFDVRERSGLHDKVVFISNSVSDIPNLACYCTPSSYHKYVWGLVIHGEK